MDFGSPLLRTPRGQLFSATRRCCSRSSASLASATALASAAYTRLCQRQSNEYTHTHHTHRTQTTHIHAHTHQTEKWRTHHTLIHTQTYINTGNTTREISEAQKCSLLQMHAMPHGHIKRYTKNPIQRHTGTHTMSDTGTRKPRHTGTHTLSDTGISIPRHTEARTFRFASSSANRLSVSTALSFDLDAHCARRAAISASSRSFSSCALRCRSASSNDTLWCTWQCKGR